jgi:biopolymer transport protein TolQ
MNNEEVVSKVISASSSQDLSIFGLISSADLVGKLVFLLLLVLSIFSWAIIIDKMHKIRLLKQKISLFEDNFWSGQPLDKLYERVKKNIDSPLCAIFVAAMAELDNRTANFSTDSHIKVGMKDRIMQSMNLVRNRESEKIESYLGFLAGVGSNATFIGLFGTVWGIMHSFQSIAMSKNTSLAVVAPGIAEALLATAIGLITAIPALSFYNYLISQTNFLSNRMDDYITELYTILSRSIDEEKL